jgi:hypothetical protein
MIDTRTDVTAKSHATSKSKAERKAERRWPTKNGCRVAVSIAIPDSTLFAPTPIVREQMLTVLDGRCPAVEVDRYQMTVAFVAESEIPTAAGREAAEIIEALTKVLGQGAESAFDLRVAASEAVYPKDGRSVDHQREIPACVGVGEAAEILGVTKQRVNQLAAAAGAFPQPVMRLKATPVWRQSDVVEFARTRSLLPGPVPASS